MDHHPDTAVPVGNEPPKPLPAHLQELVDLLPLNQWVHRSVLENAYGRSNVMRRLRKIRAEYGWAILSERRTDGANDDWYKRISDGPIAPQRIRKEVGKREREHIYSRDGWKCQMCGSDVGAGQQLTNPQCDHKVPAERGGRTILSNLQTLCTQCNLKKRQACQVCKLLTCNGCPYAFPEQYAQTIVLRLSPESAQRLEELSTKLGAPPAVVIGRLLEIPASVEEVLPVEPFTTAEP